MPFKSKNQEKWMFANHPQMAKQWAAETPNQQTLPDVSPSLSAGNAQTAPRKKKPSFGMLHDYLSKQKV